MTADRPGLCDDVWIRVDVVEVNRFYLVVRDRATSRQHTFSYDNILIGSSDEGAFFDLVLPRWLADLEGVADAR